MVTKASLIIAGTLLFTVLAFQNCGQVPSSAGTTAANGASASSGGAVVSAHACPTYDVPTCDAGSLVQSTDRDGCQAFTCASGQAFSCPTYTMPACNANQIPTSVTDASGCAVKKCMPAIQF